MKLSKKIKNKEILKNQDEKVIEFNEKQRENFEADSLQNEEDVIMANEYTGIIPTPPFTPEEALGYRSINGILINPTSVDQELANEIDQENDFKK